MHHRDKDLENTERHQRHRPEEISDRATLYSSELIVLGEMRAALSTESVFLKAHL